MPAPSVIERPVSEGDLGDVGAGRYALQRRLRGGGMAIVYVAEDRVTGERVAVKRLRDEFARDGVAFDRFEREGRVLARVDHPNVVRRVDAGRDARGLPYLVLELLAGEDLQVRVERDGVLPLREALARAHDVGEALEAVHAVGVVHHDVKPANIMVTHTPRGRALAKLIDFGVASTRLDHWGNALVGTPSYLAPEQMFGQGVADPRVDIWSLGASLYCCLTGRPPHVASSMRELMYKVAAKEPDRVEALRPDLPPGVVELLHRALARHPEERFADAGAMVRAIDACLCALPSPRVVALSASSSLGASSLAASEERTCP